MVIIVKFVIPEAFASGFEYNVFGKNNHVYG